MSGEKDAPAPETRGPGELMYIRCAWCGRWIDVKPGPMNQITHGMCEECQRHEMPETRLDSPGGVP